MGKITIFYEILSYVLSNLSLRKSKMHFYLLDVQNTLLSDDLSMTKKSRFVSGLPRGTQIIMKMMYMSLAENKSKGHLV